MVATLEGFLSDLVDTLINVTREPRGIQDVLRGLNDEVQRLSRAARSFDEGGPNVRRQEARTLATGIAILVNHEGQSHALLNQLEVLDRLLVESSGTPYRPANGLSHVQLVHLAMDGQYHPRDQVPRRPGLMPRLLPFTKWWTEIVIAVDHPMYKSRVTHTRKSLVLAVRNTDGGSHFDPGLPPNYSHLSRRNALKWEMIDGDPPKSPPVPSGDPVPATVRQIWHELEEAIRSVPWPQG